MEETEKNGSYPVHTDMRIAMNIMSPFTGMRVRNILEVRYV